MDDDSDLASSEYEEEKQRLRSSFIANTAYCYRLAESVVRTELKRIAAQAVNGRIDASKIDEDERSLIEMYNEATEAWQETCLVLCAEEGNAAAESVVINRPLAKKIDEVGVRSSAVTRGSALSSTTESWSCVCYDAPCVFYVLRILWSAHPV